jgi:hypothetical protein
MKKKLLILAGSALAVLGGVAAAQTGAPRPAPMHRDPDADETRQQVIDRVQQRFERMDLNHDGRFTPDEARQLRARMRQRMQDRMFDRMDLNHDGSITRDEMNQAHARMRQQMDERMAHRGAPDGPGGPAMDGGMGRRAPGMRRGPMGGRGMGRRDGGGQGMFGAQGYITVDQMRDAALRRFDRLDLNHDGTVTAAERQQARARMRERMEQRRQSQDDPNGAAPSQPQ